MTRKQSHCCEQQEPEKCCVPWVPPFNNELFFNSLSWPLLQPPLHLLPPLKAPSQSARVGQSPANLSDLAGHMIENSHKFFNSTTDSSQQLEVRGFLSWHGVRAVCTESICSSLKPCVTGKSEPAQSMSAYLISSFCFTAEAFLTLCQRPNSGSSYTM